MRSVPTAANVEFYARIVKEKGILRKLIDGATQIITNSYEEQGNIEETVDKAEKLIFEVAELKQRQKAYHIKELVKSGINSIDQLTSESKKDNRIAYWVY